MPESSQSSIGILAPGKTVLHPIPTDRDIARALVDAMPLERRRELMMLRIKRDWKLRVMAWHAVKNCIDTLAIRNMDASAKALKARRANAV